MYKYLLFSYENYYPSGGMNDCVFKFNNLSEITEHIKSETGHSSIAREVFTEYVEVYDICSDQNYEYNVVRDVKENIVKFLEYCEKEIGIK